MKFENPDPDRIRVLKSRSCTPLAHIWRWVLVATRIYTYFTLHLLSDWRVSDSSPLAYFHERTCELDIGAFLNRKDSKICFVGLAYGIAKAGE